MGSHCFWRDNVLKIDNHRLHARKSVTFLSTEATARNKRQRGTIGLSVGLWHIYVSSRVTSELAVRIFLLLTSSRKTIVRIPTSQRTNYFFKVFLEMGQWASTVFHHRDRSWATHFSPVNDSGLSYIGQIKRHNISVRVNKHIADFKVTYKRAYKSAVCQHALENDASHFIRFDTIDILAKENKLSPRMMRVIIKIQKAS